VKFALAQIHVEQAASSTRPLFGRFPECVFQFRNR